MAKTENYQASRGKASAAGMARGFGLKSGYQSTGINRRDIRAADADDAIAEAMAERAERKAK